MLPSVIVSAAVALCAAAAVATGSVTMPARPAPTRSFLERFRTPGPDARILRINHGWPGTPEARQAAVGEMLRQGFGGAVTNASFDGGYTGSEANWQALAGGLELMEKAGLAAWLYDEAGYPSGRAGRLVLDGHPELEAMGLFSVTARTEGAVVALTVPPGKLLLAAAHPEGSDRLRDLSASVSDGKLRWTPPPGAWRVCVFTEGRLFDGTQVAVSGVPDRAPYVDLLNPETTRRFIGLTHDRYAQRLGADLGKRVRSTFTDEPSLLSIHFTGMPYAVAPWTPAMPELFRARRGYDLISALPALVGDMGPRTARVRCDFYGLVGARFREAFFQPIRDWCKAHNVPSGGHALLEENLLQHVPLYGDLFGCFQAMDVPGIDALSLDPTTPWYDSTAGMGSDVPWNAARLAASAAELQGRSLVMCEATDFHQMMANPPIKLTDDAVRGGFAKLVVGGVTRFNTYCRMQDRTDAFWRDLNLWVARCCEALTGGFRRSDVAVVYPIETAWTRFTPSTVWCEQLSPQAREVERTSRRVCEALFRGRREFTVIDSALLERARIVGGALKWRSNAWRVVVLPCTDTLTSKAWAKLSELHAAGGTVLCVGARPTNTPAAFPAPEARRLDRALRKANAPYLPIGQEDQLAGILDRRLPATVRVAPDGPIRITHRRIDGQEVILVVNDGDKPWSGTLDLPVQGSGQALDPATGDAVALKSGKGVACRLGPYAGMIYRFARAAATTQP